MPQLLKHTAVYAWLALVGLTGLAWWLSLDLATIEQEAVQLTTTGLLVLAFFKVRLVIMHFMEVATAPLVLRLIFEAWLLIVCCVLLGIYWLT